LPNPLSLIPFDLLSQSPSFSLAETDWEAYLENSPLNKRQFLSIEPSLNASQLFAMCPISDIQNPEVPAGCIAGIYKNFCMDLRTEQKMARCQEAYNKVFLVSIFKPIGEVCPAWRFGPRSLECAAAVRNFKFQLPYMTVTSDHAAQLAANVFGSRTYSPCNPIGRISCKW
jgi:hypothetical protein